jgi:hypothetical protein
MFRLLKTQKHIFLERKSSKGVQLSEKAGLALSNSKQSSQYNHQNQETELIISIRYF